MSTKTKVVKGNTERGRSDRAAGAKDAVTVHPNNVNRDTFERATKVKPMSQADVMKIRIKEESDKAVNAELQHRKDLLTLAAELPGVEVAGMVAIPMDELRAKLLPGLVGAIKAARN